MRLRNSDMMPLFYRGRTETGGSNFLMNSKWFVGDFREFVGTYWNETGPAY